MEALSKEEKALLAVEREPMAYVHQSDDIPQFGGYGGGFVKWGESRKDLGRGHLSKREKALLELSRQGRYGDSTLRTINDELTHVNKWEATLIDKYGEKGKQLVNALGSSTINPNTGLKEKFVLETIALATIAYGAYQSATSDEGFSLGGIWDHTFGKHGLGGLLGGRDETLAMREQAKGIANESFTNTLESAQKDLGPSGNIMETKGRELGALQFEHAQQSQQAAQQTRNMQAQQGFEGANPTQQIMNQQMQDLAKQGSMQSTAKIQEAAKQHNDVLTSINTQKNQALSDYMATTTKTFPGSQQLSDLEAYIAEMKAGGEGG